MKKIWFVAAHSSDAKIYYVSSPLAEPKLIREFSCSDARLRSSEFREDSRGRVYEHFSSHRHTLNPAQKEKDHLLHDFVHQLGQYLNQSRKEALFDRLILVAAPKVLGELRQNLDSQTRVLVVASFDKNPQGFDANELWKLARGSMKAEDSINV